VTAAAFAAFYAGVSVAHVEAGLRTGDRRQPFPEEINRRLASVLTDLHFPPTENARQNLLREGVAEDHIVVTGNPVIDALDWVRTLPPPADIVELSSRIGLDRPTDPPKLVLVTAHRRENFGAPLQEICLALRDLVERYGDGIHIVYPVHPNPNVTEPAYRLLADVPGVTLMAPLDYLSLAHLMERSYLVLTDSGGLQEEAPSMGKPVLVLRNVTERPEGVEAGAVKVVGAERRRIVEEASVLLDDKAAYDRMAQAVNPYGDGHAAERIAAALLGEHVTPFVSDTTVA
jgi:UDP-N-acetylglucosamine 2-epimerase (non-hydrolysing)